VIYEGELEPAEEDEKASSYFYATGEN